MFRKKLKIDDLKYPSFLTLNSKKYLILVDFYNKKSSSINLKKDNLIEIRLSLQLNKIQAQNHIDILLEKFSKKILKKHSFDNLTLQDAIVRGYFYISDNKFYLNPKDNIQKIIFKENIFTFPKNIDLEFLEKKIIKVLCKIFYEKINQEVIFYNNQTYKYTFNNISVKYVKSKWGHCTHNNDLMFNLKLLNVPKEVFHYVIAHELSHIKYKNHSDNFWREVSKFCPKYKLLRKYLKNNYINLFNEKPI